MNGKHKSFLLLREFAQRLLVGVLAFGLTLIFFMVLPLIQTLARPPRTDLLVQAVDTAQLEPPPPPPEEEQEQEEQEEQEPPELLEETQPLDIAQLELLLNPGFNQGMLAGDFSIKLNTLASNGGSADALFSIADLDQKPRVIYQPPPLLETALRKKAPGTVYIVFVVDQNGRVVNPVVQNSTDAIFEKPALSAVEKWKFEPGKRNGRPVRFRMRVPITFPKES